MRTWSDPRVKPPFGVEIDWNHPLAQGLSFVMLCNEGAGAPQPLWVDQGSIPTRGTYPLANGAVWATVGHFGSSGINVVTSNSRVNWFGSGITYRVPQVQGTLIASLAPAFSPASGVGHYVVQFGARKDLNFPNYQALVITKEGANNNITMGWVWNGDWRTTFSSSGLWSFFRPLPLQWGVTWDTTASVMQRAYFEGIEKGNTATITTGDTASGGGNNVISLGNATYNNAGWPFGAVGTFEWVALWRRALSPYEMAWMRAEPFALYTMPIRRRFFIPSSDSGFANLLLLLNRRGESRVS